MASFSKRLMLALIKLLISFSDKLSVTPSNTFLVTSSILLTNVTCIHGQANSSANVLAQNPSLR